MGKRVRIIFALKLAANIVDGLTRSVVSDLKRSGDCASLGHLLRYSTSEMVQRDRPRSVKAIASTDRPLLSHLETPSRSRLKR